MLTKSIFGILPVLTFLFSFFGLFTPLALSNTTQVPVFINPAPTGTSTISANIKTIRFLTTDDFPPFNFIDPQGKLDGFNVAIARTLCFEIKARCTIQALPWDKLQEGMKKGQGDAIIAGLAVSDKTIRQFAFTETYLRFPARFFANAAFADSFGDFKQPKGLKIGVEKQSAHEAFLKTYFPDNQLESFDDQDALRDAIRTGKVKIGFGDGVQTSFWLQSASAQECCRFVGGPYLNSDFFGLGLTIAVPPARQDLKDRLDEGLRRLTRNGKYAEIYLKYFPINFF